MCRGTFGLRGGSGGAARVTGAVACDRGLTGELDVGVAAGAVGSVDDGG